MPEPDYEKYLDLFLHRRDVFSEQQTSGAYFPVLREFTEDDLAEHLAGMASYGTYVVAPDNTVKFIVFDLDVTDESATEKLCQLVQEMVVAAGGSTDCLMRETSGRKGTHVWLFLSEPVPAEKVRRWVGADFMPKWREFAEANGFPAAIEVFPKQDTI